MPVTGMIPNVIPTLINTWKSHIEKMPAASRPDVYKRQLFCIYSLKTDNSSLFKICSKSVYRYIRFFFNTCASNSSASNRGDSISCFLKYPVVQSKILLIVHMGLAPISLSFLHPSFQIGFHQCI